MNNKLLASAAVVAMAVAGFIGHIVDQATVGHPHARALVYRIENEATKIIRAGFQCGVERWSVKTLSDPGAASVDMTPTITTIPQLRSILAPSPYNYSSTRSSPVETHLWRLGHTHVVAYKEELDSDIHLKLQSTIDGSTMIVEIPDPNCVTNPAARLKIAQARADFLSEVGQPTGYYQTVDVRAAIEGVGFFDFVHGQNGVAPNGVELHPVLLFHRNS